MVSVLRLLALFALLLLTVGVGALPAAAQGADGRPDAQRLACPTGVEPARDLDGDCVDDDLERNGYDRSLAPCTPGAPGCFVTDPTAWSSDGDPYSDFQEATGVNMDNTVEAPYNNPLVAAMPRIEVSLLRYRFTPTATITDSQGKEISTSSTTEFSVETTVGVSYTVGVEASAGLDPSVKASSETTTSFSVTAGYSSSQTQGQALNWETATSQQADHAANLELDIVARNVGSATALSVTPTFNLLLGGEPLGTYTPSTPFPANLRPDGQASDYITVPQQGSGQVIKLSLAQLQRLQRGAPLTLRLVGLDAGISRWRPEDSNWSCPEPCRWEEFQDQIDARTLRLILDFGYSGDPDAAIPRAYQGNPFEYRVYTGSPNARPGFTLRDVFRFTGYDLVPQGDQVLVNGRPYPRTWYPTSGPEAAGTRRDSTFFDYWQRAGEPVNLLDMVMPRGVALLLASPDPVDPGPVLAGGITGTMRQIVVSATPKGGFPIASGEAHVFDAGGHETVVPLQPVPGTNLLATPDSLLYPVAAGRSYVVVRDVTGAERRLGPGLTPGVPVATDCADYPRGSRFQSPGWTTTNGIATLFLDGDLDRPATVYCAESGSSYLTDVWYPQPNDLGSLDALGVAIVDRARRVAVGEGFIVVSDDAGQSWRRVALAPADAVTFHAVAFREGTATGVAVGLGGVFMRTTDGGQTWTRATVSGTGNYYDVDYAGGDTWYAVGENRVRRSTDDGLTWTSAAVYVFDDQGNPVTRPNFATLTAVTFISEDVGAIGDYYMAADATGDRRGRTYLTNDGGTTWQELTVVTYQNDLTFDGRDAWYIVGRNVITRRTVGPNARFDVVFTAPTAQTFVAVAFPTPDIGYAATDVGPVYRTEDGGTTWSAAYGGYPTPTHPGTNYLRDLAMLDANVGAVVGTDGVLGATDSGGGFPVLTVDADDDPPPLATGPTDKAVYLEANYPNPFTMRTTLAYRLDRPQPVTLEVFDLLGRRVAALVDAPQAAGRHDVRFDASGLASGVYVVRLRTADALQVRQVTLLR